MAFLEVQASGDFAIRSYRAAARKGILADRFSEDPRFFLLSSRQRAARCDRLSASYVHYFKTPTVLRMLHDDVIDSAAFDHGIRTFILVGRGDVTVPTPALCRSSARTVRESGLLRILVPNTIISWTSHRRIE